MQTTQGEVESSALIGSIDDEDSSLLETLTVLARHWVLLTVGPIAIGLTALGITYVVPKTYTARTSFLPPQQQGPAATAALSSLGALANLAGGGGIRTPADQFAALMQSASVQDRIVDRFKLIEVYDVKYKVEAKRELAERLRINVSKRDGIISVELDDHSPERAAAIANAHIEELRTLTASLAVTEAQQRRVFFDRQLADTRARLNAAQAALQGSGVGAGAMKAEPKAAAEYYARLRAEVTGAEVKLQTLRGVLVDTAPEVIQQLATLNALRTQLARVEQAGDAGGGPDYIGKYREYKYQEAMFEFFARQFELARIDEAREGSLIQVIDVAQPPEKKSKPKRANIAILSTVAGAMLLIIWVLGQARWRQLANSPKGREKITQLKNALARR